MNEPLDPKFPDEAPGPAGSKGPEGDSGRPEEGSASSPHLERDSPLGSSISSEEDPSVEESFEEDSNVSEPFLAIRRPVALWQRGLLGALPILALLGAWWFVTGSGPAEERIMSPTILPSPLEVVQSFPSLWWERALTRNVLISLLRVIEGFAVAVLIAFPLGLAMGAFSRVKAIFNPLSVLGAYLPIPALVPLTLSLFGTGEKQKIAFLALAFLIYLLPLIIAAVEEVDEVYLKTGYTLGATRWQTVTKVLLPIALPDIFQSLRLGFGIGWSYIILAEMVDIGKGVGGIIITSQRIGPREHIYLVLVVIILVAFLTDTLWASLGKRLFPYREQR